MSDPNFTAKVQFDQEPEYKKLMRDLQHRQEQETKHLQEKQTQQRIDFGKQPGVTRQHLDDNNQRLMQERAEQSKKHRAEMDRYTREYHDAKVLREAQRQKEKEQEKNLTR